MKMVLVFLKTRFGLVYLGQNKILINESMNDCLNRLFPQYSYDCENIKNMEIHLEKLS